MKRYYALEVQYVTDRLRIETVYAFSTVDFRNYWVSLDCGSDPANQHYALHFPNDRQISSAIFKV